MLLCKSPKGLCYRAVPGSTGSASDKLGITFAATRNCCDMPHLVNVLGFNYFKDSQQSICRRHYIVTVSWMDQEYVVVKNLVFRSPWHQ